MTTNVVANIEVNLKCLLNSSGFDINTTNNVYQYVLL